MHRSVFLSCVAIFVLLTCNTAFGQRTAFRSIESAAAPAPSEPAPLLDVERIRDLIHESVNAERMRMGLRPLRRDTSLERISEMHSRDMALKGYFDHVDLEGRNATQRGHASRYICIANLENPIPRSVGENLFAAFRYSEYTLTYYPGEVVADYRWKSETDIARETVQAWMGSPPHRANLLLPEYGRQGIGLFLSSSLELFVTQNLC